MKSAWTKKLFCRMPELKTDRLLLRRVRLADTDDMYAYSYRRDVTKYLLWEPHPDREHTRQYIAYLQEKYREGEYYDWAVTLANDGKMIGTCGFAALTPEHAKGEIGYVINPEFRGNGYAPEAVMAVLRYGFDVLGLHRVEARCFEENTASARVMEKCGLEFEGIGRQSMKIKGAFRNIATYAILEDQYREENDAPKHE